MTNQARQESAATARPGFRAGAVAVLAHLVLVDVAVETSFAGSSVRWIVAGFVSAYVVLSVLLRRRVRLETRAWGALWLLLALLALSAWHPGSATTGLTLLRQPSSTLLAAVTAAAVLLAGWILIRAEFVPRVAKVLAGLLMAYGAAATVWGIIGGTSYSELFRGQSFWMRLPFWLQGAFVGGLVVLPLGLVVQMIQNGLSSRRRTGSSGWGLQRAVALALSLLMTISGVTTSPVQPRPTMASARDGTDTSTAPQTSPYVSPRSSVPLDSPLELPPTASPSVSPEELVAKAEAVRQEIRQERYNVEAFARTLGPGVEPAFEFVRDHINYEAYPGVLRGAEGTFITRAGNGPDRSLLLARLLELKGVPVRYAIGRLARTDAERLYAHIFDAPVASVGSPAWDEATTSEADKFWERVERRARRDYQVIRAALGDLLPAPPKASNEEVLGEIEQHVWIQAQMDGQWIDLDSAFDDATVGRTSAQPEKTVDQLPGELRQHVTVRVTAETLEDGRLKTSTALDVTMPAEDLLDRRVFLLHVPANAGGELGVGFGAGPQRHEAWTPTLLVDEVPHSGTPISFDDAPIADVGNELVGGDSASTFVAEWLEFDIAFPDGRRELTRRALADRAGVAWRQGDELDSRLLRQLPRDDQGPVTAQTIYNIWFSAGKHDLAKYADAVLTLTDVIRQSDPQLTATDSSHRGGLQPFALLNFGLLVWSDHFAVQALNDSRAHRFYADSPRILIFSVGPDLREGGQGAIGQIDLRRDHLRGLARDRSVEPGVVERKIWFGALEGALEHESGVQEAALAGTDPSEAISTSSLLTSEGTIALRPKDAARGQSLTSSRETAARIAQALSTGATLVVPLAALRAGRAGWWEISGQYGDARAALDDLNTIWHRPLFNPPVRKVVPLQKVTGNEHLLTRRIAIPILGGIVETNVQTLLIVAVLSVALLGLLLRAMR